MSHTRGRAALLLMAAFLAGVLCGGAGFLLAARNNVGPVHARPRGHGGYVNHLTRTLDLTEVQRDSVRAILERHRPAMDSLRREVAPRFETLQRTMRSEIRAQLTPDQQQKLEAMTRRSDSLRNRGGRDAPR